MMLFNLKNKNFSPDYCVENKNGWIAVTQQQIDEISASLTSGGDVWLEKGEIICSGKAPGENYIFDSLTRRWEISPEKLTALLTERKNAVLLHLAAKADELKTGLLAGYPQTEIESFYRQEKEALAWQADHNTATPMLSQIARVRGVPLEVLISKVIEKSAQFAVAIGIIIGQRQAFEDRLMAVQTLEELEPLSQEIEQWQFQVN